MKSKSIPFSYAASVIVCWALALLLCAFLVWRPYTQAQLEAPRDAPSKAHADVEFNGTVDPYTFVSTPSNRLGQRQTDDQFTVIEGWYTAALENSEPPSFLDAESYLNSRFAGLPMELAMIEWRPIDRSQSMWGSTSYKAFMAEQRISGKSLTTALESWDFPALEVLDGYASSPSFRKLFNEPIGDDSDFRRVEVSAPVTHAIFPKDGAFRMRLFAQPHPEPVNLDHFILIESICTLENVDEIHDGVRRKPEDVESMVQTDFPVVFYATENVCELKQDFEWYKIGEEYLIADRYPTLDTDQLRFDGRQKNRYGSMEAFQRAVWYYSDLNALVLRPGMVLWRKDLIYKVKSIGDAGVEFYVTKRRMGNFAE